MGLKAPLSYVCLGDVGFACISHAEDQAYQIRIPKIQQLQHEIETFWRFLFHCNSKSLPLRFPMLNRRNLIATGIMDGYCYEMVELASYGVHDERMKASIGRMEDILMYTFRDKSLLEDALTHPSCNTSRSYERLEFVGDAVLALVFSNFLYLTYPNLEPGHLSSIRAANISTEKLARLAVRHNLHRFIRLKAPVLAANVEEFALAVQKEDNPVSYGGTVKAPKLLADIVESIAAAIYIDCGFDLKALWMVFRGFLEPIAMLENLVGRPQPVSMLYELCQKHGKEVTIKHRRSGSKSIASIYVDGELVASGSSSQKEIAKLNAAEEALLKLKQLERLNDDCRYWVMNEEGDIEGAKQKLSELCSKKRVGKPVYRIEKEYGPSHDKRYVCSVRIEPGGAYAIAGIEKSRVKDAESSAASMMLQSIYTHNSLELR